MATEKKLSETYTDKESGRTATREGTCPVLASGQEAIAHFEGKVENWLAYTNDAIEKAASAKLRAAARLEVVGVEDTVERLKSRMIKDAEKLGVSLSAEIADSLARQALGLAK